MRTSFRTAAACALTVMLAAALTGPVAAGPQYTITEFTAGLRCTGSTPGGTPVTAHVGSDTHFGDNAYVVVGAEDASELEGFGREGWNDGNPDFVLDVYDGSMEQVGVGRLSGSTRIVGQTQTVEKNRFGNQRVHTFTTTYDLVAPLVLDLPGYPPLTLHCEGSKQVSDYVRNAPATTNRTERRFFDRVRCEGNAVVGLFGPEDGDYYLSIDVVHRGDQYHLFGPVDPSRDAFTAVLPLRDSETGEQVAELPVAVTLETTGESTRNVLRTSIAKITQTLTPYAVSASVELPWGTASGTCEALEIVTHEIVTAAQGPRPVGPPPVNDTVAGAVRVAPSQTVHATNRAAVRDVEARMPCAGLPPGRSLWYRFRGTGDPVRIDTARSGFDTVLTVYAASLRPIRCADDHGPGAPLPPSTLQARLTVPTVAGRMYYVQVAGAFADHGRLALSIR